MQWRLKHISLQFLYKIHVFILSFCLLTSTLHCNKIYPELYYNKTITVNFYGAAVNI